MTVRNFLLCSYDLETYNFYKGSMKIYKGSMSLFRTLVWTNEITVFGSKKL